MKNLIPVLLVVFSLVVSGCSSISDALKGELRETVGNDLQRQSELAGKYGKPELKVCADFLIARISKLDDEDTKLTELLAEPTEGIFSAALKAVLIKEHLAALNDPARADAFRKEFDVACKSVAGQIVLNVARDAAKVMKRGN